MIDNQYLVYKQIDLLEDLFDEIIVVSNNNELYKNKNVKVVQDIIKKKSPLIGLHAGLSSSSNELNYLIACDMPNIDINYLNYIMRIKESKEVYAVKQNNHYEPFNAFYNKSILNKLESFTKDNLKFQDFIETLNSYDIRDITDFKNDMFYNVNTPEDLQILQGKENTYEIIEIEKEFMEKTYIVDDYVIKEFPISLFINDEKYVTLLITPTNIKELIVGYMKSEKIIESYNEIEKLSIHKSEFKVHVKLNHEIEVHSGNRDRLLTSGCGVGTKFHEDLDNLMINSIISNFKLDKQTILDATEELNNKSGLFKLTGGVHSCLYFYNDTQVYMEDIGRHNAVDKVIGYIELNNVDTTNSYIFSSGRISSDMLIKCAISGIPFVLSRSAPTSLGVSLADKFGITLIGFVRGNKFNVYTNKSRVAR